MEGASVLDTAIVVLYIALCIVVGLLLRKRKWSLESFLLGDRRVGFIHSFGTFFSTICGGSIAFTYAVYAFQYGVSIFWGALALLLAFLVFYPFVPLLKKVADNSKYYTYPDMLNARFGKSTQVVGAIITFFIFCGLTATNISITGTIFSAVFGWEAEASILVAAIVIVIYILLAGFVAVIWTDLIQFLIILFGIGFITLPLSLWAIGGFSGFGSLPTAFFDPLGWGIENIFGIFIIIVPVFFTSQDVWQRVFAAKDVETAKHSVLASGFVLFFISIASVLIGMTAAVIVPETTPNLSIPTLLSQVLPMGLLGLVLVGYLAVFMSSADSFILAAASNLVRDFYQSYINRKASENKLVSALRIGVLVAALVSTGISLLFPSFVEILFSVVTWMLILVPVTLCGFFWKRINGIGATTSIVVGWLIAIFWAFGPGTPETAGVVALIPTIVVLIGVSYLTKPPKREQLEPFRKSSQPHYDSFS